MFRNPLTHERAKNLSQSGKLSNFRCIHAFKNIKHQKQQKRSCQMIAQKKRWIRQFPVTKSAFCNFPSFVFFFLSSFNGYITLYLFHISRDSTSTSPLHVFGLQKYDSFLASGLYFVSEAGKDERCVESYLINHSL